MRSLSTLLYSVAHENPHFIIRDCTGLEGAKTGRPSYGFENPLSFRLVYGRARFLKVDKILVDAHGCVNLHQRKRTGQRTGEQSSMGIPRSGNPLLLVVLVICTVSGTRAQSSSPDAGCWSQVAQIPHDAVQFGHGVAEAPRNAIRPRNLKWELPIAAATGILIARVDVPASNRIQSLPFQHLAARWTNIGLGIELGTSGLLYGIGCAGHRSEHAASTGFTALEAIGAANGIAALLKAGMNRQYPLPAQQPGRVLGRRQVISFWARRRQLRLRQRTFASLSA